MRKKIDEDYVAAVRQAAEALGSQSDLARAAGLPQGTISSLLTSKTPRKYVSETIYNRLYPFVSPYLPEQPEIPIGPAVPPPLPGIAPVNPYYVNTINNTLNAPGVPVAPAQVVVPPPDVPLKSGTIPAEAILHAMQGLTPEEKARFLKELYTDCSHETDNSEVEE